MSNVKPKKHEITAQVISCATLKVVGGMRVVIDIPEALGKDIALMSVFAAHQAHVKLTVEPYTPPEEKAEEFGRG